MEVIWKYCGDGRILPETDKTVLCLFYSKIKKPRIEACVLLEDLDEPNSYYWTLKGSVDGKEVFPFAWLEVNSEYPEHFFERLEVEKVVGFGLKDYLLRLE